MGTATTAEELIALLTEPSEQLKKETGILEILMKQWDLNNTEAAKILGVEPWSVGAWLSGKREISSKYREKIEELLKIPIHEDLVITPALNALVNNIRHTFDEEDVPKLKNALLTIIDEIKYKLRSFSINQDDGKLNESIADLLDTYDDLSIAQLNQTISNALKERVYIASISAETYAKKCIHLLKDTWELDLELEDSNLLAYYSTGFDDTQKIDEYTDPDEFREKQSQLEEDAHHLADCIFKYTAFEKIDWNSQWIGDDAYMIDFKISLDNAKFKESLKTIMNRCLWRRPSIIDIMI